MTFAANWVLNSQNQSLSPSVGGLIVHQSRTSRTSTEESEIVSWCFEPTESCLSRIKQLGQTLEQGPSTVFAASVSKGNGIACLLERRTRDRKVASSNPGRDGGRIFFSRVNFAC